jgi:hypothetical protein
MEGSVCTIYMYMSVIHGGSLSQPFILSEVRQGCSLSAFLFLIVIDWFMEKLIQDHRRLLQWTLALQLEYIDLLMMLLSCIIVTTTYRKQISLPQHSITVPGFKSNKAKIRVLILRWENLGILSPSQLCTYLVKSHNNTFRGVNWKILRLSNVLLQFTDKGGDDCFDVIHGSVDKSS